MSSSDDFKSDVKRNRGTYRSVLYTFHQGRALRNGDRDTTNESISAFFFLDCHGRLISLNSFGFYQTASLYFLLFMQEHWATFLK